MTTVLNVKFLRQFNYKSAQLSKMAERRDSRYIYAKQKPFLPVPSDEEDATKCCDAGTCSAQKSREIDGVLENLTGR